MKKGIAIASIVLLSTFLLASPIKGTATAATEIAGNSPSNALMLHAASADLQARVRLIPGMANAHVMVTDHSAFVLLDADGTNLTKIIKNRVSTAIQQAVSIQNVYFITK
jgi:hypothetical protein